MKTLYKNVTEKNLKLVIGSDGSVTFNEIRLPEVKHPTGYLEVIIPANGINYHFMIHRLVAKAFYGFTNGHVVHHKDFNKHNNSANNLEVLTAKEHSQIIPELTEEQLMLLEKFPKLCFKCVAHICKVSIYHATQIKKKRGNK